MTANNTTGDKLVASVRKTKTEASSVKTVRKKKVTKKAATASKTRAAKPRTTAVSKKPTANSANRFQLGRRVWPD